MLGLFFLSQPRRQIDCRGQGRDMRNVIVFTAALMCLTGIAWADVVTIDGGIYTGCYSNNGDDVVVNYGEFSNFKAASYAWPFYNERGAVTINGGDFSGTTSDNYGYGFYNNSDSPMTVNGGEFQGTASASYGYGFYNRGTVTIAGGSFQGAASCFAFGFVNRGKAYINEGSFRGSASGIDADFGYGFSNYGTAFIAGGEFYGTASILGFGFSNFGTVYITGGKFSGTASSWAFDLSNGSRGNVVIYGTFAHYGELPRGSGSLSGTLANGVYETIHYQNNGSIYLMPVPEPSSILALLCEICGVGGVLLRRKHV